MRQNDTMVSADQLMSDLDNPRSVYDGGRKESVLASILARIDAGHEYDTQFITTPTPDGSQAGREFTAIKRNALMNKMKTTAIQTPIPLTHPDGSVQFDSVGNPLTISVTDTSTPAQRTAYRQALKSSPSYTDTASRLSDTYEQVQKDIKSGRNKLSVNAAGNYLKNSALAAVATAGVKTTIDYLNQTPTGGENITPHKTVGEQAEFKLSGHQTGDMTSHNETINTLHNGDTIDAQIEVAVDGVAAKTGAFSHYLTEASKVSTEI